LKLDEDPQRAEEKYILLCSRLEKFFENKRCHKPVDLAEETITRVVRKIFEGKNIPAVALSSYTYTVAQNVFYEYLRDLKKRGEVSLEELSPYKHPFVDPIEVIQKQQESLSLEQKLACLDKCLEKLPAEKRAMITSYYGNEESVNKENRKTLADSIGISASNLRVRAHRSRGELEKCIISCLEQLSGH
jgi:RNA polymerase sigma factor (sigma-70 family)